MWHLRETIKWLLYPGINLHARLRRRLLPRFFGTGPAPQGLRVLDAGCGNGMLSHAAYLKGNRVRGISIKEKEIGKCRLLFNDFLGIPEVRMRFEIRNLYTLDEHDGMYDEIICSEVIEHLSDDKKVVRSFYERLNPGGVLHLNTPNAEHPDNIAHHLDEKEEGGHVRPGYTWESLRELLEGAGFEIDRTLGLGGPIRQAFNKSIINSERRFGFAAGFIIFLVAQFFVWMDPRHPRTPYCIYMRAVKQ
jgi:SAM-dependent methyltransferase